MCDVREGVSLGTNLAEALNPTASSAVKTNSHDTCHQEHPDEQRAAHLSHSDSRQKELDRADKPQPSSQTPRSGNTCSLLPTITNGGVHVDDHDNDDDDDDFGDGDHHDDALDDDDESDLREEADQEQRDEVVHVKSNPCVEEEYFLRNIGDVDSLHIQLDHGENAAVTGHAMTSTKDGFVVVGGYYGSNRGPLHPLRKFNFSNNEFENLAPRPFRLPIFARTGTSLVCYLNRFLITFGGFVRSWGSAHTNDIAVFDLKKQQPLYEDVDYSVAGTKPHIRDKHSAVIYKDKMYVFGGWGSKVPSNDPEFTSDSSEESHPLLACGWTNTFHALDLTPLKDIVRREREQDAATTEDIGHGKETKVATPASATVSTAQEQSRESASTLSADSDAGDDMGEEDRFETTRSLGHFFSLFQSALAVNHPTEFASDLDPEVTAPAERPTEDRVQDETLDAAPALQWEKIAPNGDVPMPRAAHTACLYKKEMFVFGGRTLPSRTNDLYAFNFQTGLWRHVDLFGDHIPLRSWHACALIPGRPFMLIHGGLSAVREVLSDVFLINLESGHVHQLPSFVPRAWHSCVVYKQHLFTYGGSLHPNVLEEVNNEVWRYRIEPRSLEERCLDTLASLVNSHALQVEDLATVLPDSDIPFIQHRASLLHLDKTRVPDLENQGE